MDFARVLKANFTQIVDEADLRNYRDIFVCFDANYGDIFIAIEFPWVFFKVELDDVIQFHAMDDREGVKVIGVDKPGPPSAWSWSIPQRGVAHEGFANIFVENM